MHRDGHRHRVVHGVALRLQAAVLGDADVVAVHRDDKTVKVRESAEESCRQADLALCATIHRQILPYRHSADRVAAVGVGKDSDGIGCVESIVTVIAVGEGKNKAVAYHLRGGRRSHRHIGHGIERATVPVDGGGLLQEVVERPPHHTLRVGERRGVVEEILRDGQVLVHIGDVVHVLVPHLAGGCPGDAGGLEDVQIRLVGVSGTETSQHHQLGTAVRVHIRHNRILHHRALAKGKGGQHIYRNRVVASKMAVAASVHNSDCSLIADQQVVFPIVVEVKHTHGVRVGVFVHIDIPHEIKTGSSRIVFVALDLVARGGPALYHYFQGIVIVHIRYKRDALSILSGGDDEGVGNRVIVNIPHIAPYRGIFAIFFAHKHIQVAVKIEIRHLRVPVNRDPSRRDDAFSQGDTVPCRTISVGDEHLIDFISQDKIRLGVANHIRHTWRGQRSITIMCPRRSRVSYRRVGNQQGSCFGIINFVANTDLRISVAVKIGKAYVGGIVVCGCTP